MTDKTSDPTKIAAAAGKATTVVTPPSDANIPAPPHDWAAPNGDEYRAVRPKDLEKTVMSDAVKELRRFTDYTATLGKTVPPYAVALEIFDAANQWSSMRARAAAWDVYCAAQEGVCWLNVRRLMSQIKPSFRLALKADPELGAKYLNLVTLLAAKSEITARGHATRRLNAKAVAEGEPPHHGKVGKKRKRAAEKKILGG